MGKFIRVEDTRTGHEYTCDEYAFDADHMKRLRDPAEQDGVVVPPVYKSEDGDVTSPLDPEVPAVTTTKTGKSA